MRKLSVLLGLIGWSCSSIAQQVRPATSAQIYNEIARLKNLTTVLYLAAHPDDENTRLLAWLANDQHLPTAYLSLTRGDGGQNILGSEQGPALGLIRTHELMEARRLDGAEQYFARAVDFGFSKNPEETFKHWNDYILTGDVAWIYRKLRPDVVICRFPPTSEAGHGQHSASAILAAKAFKVSGNKLQYTEQFQHGVQPWQPRRILWNTFRFGSFNTTAENQFKIWVGNYSPTIGMGYGELAGISRSIHRSQGAGTPSVAGQQREYFRMVDGDSLSGSLFDGIDISWNRVGRKDIGEKIDKVLQQFDYNHPDRSIAPLLAIRGEVTKIKDDFWRERKLQEIDEVLLHCSGFMAEIVTKEPQATAGTTLPFTFRVIARSSDAPVSLSRLSAPGFDSSLALNLGGDTLITFEHTLTVPATQPVTEPYWLASPSTTPGLFGITSDTVLGQQETPNTLVVRATVRIGGQPVQVPLPLSYKKLDPLKGDVVEALRVVPAVSVTPQDNLIIIREDGSIRTAVRLHAYENVPALSLNIFGNNKNLLTIQGLQLRSGSDTLIPVNLTAKQVGEAGKNDFFLDAEAMAGGKRYNRSLRLIQYNHLPTLQYFTPAVAQVLHRTWKTTAQKIGYIEGAGDYAPTLLKLSGLSVDMLKESDMSSAEKLRGYDAILVGIRAINTEKRMSYWMPVLLDYVQNGGTLVMQYNTLQDMATTQLGPYPLTLSSKRVTEEDAAVKMLLPDHRLFSYPNKITADDFKGWVQERSLYVPTKWDSQYQALLEMNDTGEEPLQGALLYAPYGKGQFVYTSLSLFRQLPAGQKGGIRLLMNMLSVGK